MEPDYWLERWKDGRTGFHQDQPTPLLAAHWDGLGVASGARVLVPLTGKSLDMAWLAGRGHRVLGVELSQLAVEQFFAAHALEPEVHDTPAGRVYRAGPVEMIHGDVFALDDETLAGCDAVYDRAALIALPPDMRARYARELYARLPTGCKGLLVTLEYPPDEMQAPPFSVPEDEVRVLFAGDWQVDVLERRAILDQQPAFIEQGLTALETVAYRLQRRG